jgi:hypothetical protein
LTSFVIRPSLQVFAEIEELGTFVAAGRPPRAHRSILPWVAYGGAGFAVVGAGVAYFLWKRAKTRKRRKRKRPPVRKKPR